MGISKALAVPSLWPCEGNSLRWLGSLGFTRQATGKHRLALLLFSLCIWYPKCNEAMTNALLPLQCIFLNSQRCLRALSGRTLASQTPCLVTSARIMTLSEPMACCRVSELPQTLSVPLLRKVTCIPNPDSFKDPTSYWPDKIVNTNIFLCGQLLASQAIHFKSTSSDPQTWRLRPY